MKAKISVVVITKNEEKYIRMCLESVKWVDEIIIVDSYSKDKTIEIAKEYTDKIYEHYFHDFASQRNFALEKTNGDWILSIDADEVASGELILELRNIPESILFKYACFRVPIRNYFFSKELRFGGWYPDYHLRFFKKGTAKWQGAVHENLQISGEIGYLRGDLLHYAYDTISEFITKTNFYTTKEIEESDFDSGILKLIFAPLKNFLYRYIVKQGFRDGVHGLMVAFLMSVYVFILHAKKYEKGLK